MENAGHKKVKLVSLVIGINLLFLPLVNCKKEEGKVADTVSKPTLSGVVLFVVGDVQSGTKKIKTGDVILENESVKTGKNSACDLQIKDSDAGIVMRMKSESSFQLKTIAVNGKQVPSTVVSIGTAMVNVSGKLKSGENFQVVTPTQTAGVRGTKFEVNVSKDGSTTLSVTEGKVASRVRIPEAEELPIEVQEKSLTISTINKTIESQEQIIEAGQKTSVTKSQTDKILKETGLGESIKQINLNLQSKLSSEEVQKAVSTIDKDNQVAGKENPVFAKSLKDNGTLKVETTKNGEVEAKLKEYAELIAIEKQKLESGNSVTVAGAVKERNAKSEDALLKRIEQITGKSLQTLILKSGKKVKGVIFLESNLYYVLTTDGQETYKEEEVDSIEL
ncbi:MAG TPA: FecR family protein [Leptospiraceae bacterium]|nr:FecR family protein [Leptospiraceae bacterium]HRG76032.1 FecR family protein [Leptospiraceae bacterium]